MKDKKRYVSTKLWSDTWIMDELNPLDRLLFVYLLTNDKTNIAGVYEISLKKVALETGIEKDNLLKMIDRMYPRVKYVDGFIVLKNAQKHQNFTNPQIKAGITTILSELPKNVHDALLNDDSYMTHEDSSHLDRDRDLDRDTKVYMSVSPKKLTKTNTTSNSSKKKEEDFIQELHTILGGTRPLKALTSYRDNLKRRLKTFTYEEIREATLAMTYDEYMMGQSDRGNTKYATVEYILRNDKNVDRFLQDDSGSVPDPENRGKLKVDLKSINWDEV